MPTGWNDKDERMYEHIQDSEREQGRSAEKAKQIAAATVNKQRTREGRTARSGGRSSGETREALYAEAKRLGIKGRSRMTKQQLAAAVRRAR